MFLPITLPRGVACNDFKRLRAHAAWYLREAQRHGPGYGSKRFARQRLRRLRHADASASAQPASPAARARPAEQPFRKRQVTGSIPVGSFFQRLDIRLRATGGPLTPVAWSRHATGWMRALRARPPAPACGRACLMPL